MESNGGRGVGVASLLLFRQRQKISRLQTVALARNCDFGKVLRSLIYFLSRGKMTTAKTKPTECKVHAVLRFLMATHYSAAAIHQEIYTLYGPVLWTKGYNVMSKKFYPIIGFVHFISSRINMYAEERSD